MSDAFVYTTPEDERARPLIEELIHEYSSRYAEFPEATQEMESFPASLFAPPDGAFVLLLRDGVAIAGGAFMRFDSHTAEFKRIWTRTDLRRQGLGRKVLGELETCARGRGYDRVYLTTGFRQPEAHALYFSADYTALFDRTLDPAVYGLLPFVKALRSLSEPLDTALRWARRMDVSV